MTNATDKLTQAAALRDSAARHERDAVESFDRCDTDGFLSQWASGRCAERDRLAADIVEHDGKWHFLGLYDGNRRVAARLISSTFYGRTKLSWLLADDEAAKYGRKFIPFNGGDGRGRILKALGLAERQEWAAAAAKLAGANANAVAVRTGDAWGTDSLLDDE